LSLLLLHFWWLTSTMLFAYYFPWIEEVFLRTLADSFAHLFGLHQSRINKVLILISHSGLLGYSWTPWYCLFPKGPAERQPYSENNFRLLYLEESVQLVCKDQGCNATFALHLSAKDFPLIGCRNHTTFSIVQFICLDA